ncbi:MAG: hypothetical protein EKK45_25845 [Curvibacter sp.]|nr:MAG: hypothetical protein EKK45_25845 [Curvibacter sp.]
MTDLPAQALWGQCLSRFVSGLLSCLVAAVLWGYVAGVQAAGFAWSDTGGWVNAGAGGGITVYPDHLEGYVWMENAGWIRLGSHTGGGVYTYLNTTATNWGVNRSGSTLTGYAWSESSGWIDMAPSGAGVSLDTATGQLSGNAWSENLGWIRFAGTAIDNQRYQAVATALLQSSGSKADQTISVGVTQTLLAVRSSAVVTATASSGLPVTLTSLTASVCTVAGSTVQSLAFGNCQIAANQAGSLAFNPAPQVVLNLTVGETGVAVPTLSALFRCLLVLCLAGLYLGHRSSKR